MRIRINGEDADIGDGLTIAQLLVERNVKMPDKERQPPTHRPDPGAVREMKIDKGVFDAMLAAARQAAPLEACGLLGGRHGHATEFCELHNADASGEHYRSECFDVTPFAHAITEYLIPLVGSYNLPRKFKIAVSGCAADCALAQVMDLGEALAIVLDDGEPIRNVPASFRAEGQEVEEAEDLGHGHWRVVVRKRRG